MARKTRNGGVTENHLARRMKEPKRSAHFPQPGTPTGVGRFAVFSCWTSQLSALSLSCIITTHLTEGKRGGGACVYACVCVYVVCALHAGVNRDVDWRSISLPVRGEALSHEGSDVINPRNVSFHVPPLSFSTFLCLSPSVCEPIPVPHC